MERVCPDLLQTMHIGGAAGEMAWSGEPRRSTPCGGEVNHGRVSAHPGGVVHYAATSMERDGAADAESRDMSFPRGSLRRRGVGGGSSLSLCARCPRSRTRNGLPTGFADTLLLHEDEYSAGATCALPIRHRGRGIMKAAAPKLAFDNGGAFIQETRREVEQYLARGSTRIKGAADALRQGADRPCADRCLVVGADLRPSGRSSASRSASSGSSSARR